MNPIPGKLVESVFKRVLASDITPELKTQLAGAGLDLSGPMQPSYPRAVWYQAIELTAKTLFAQDPAPTQLRKLGGHIITSLQSRQIIKSSYLTMAKLMGPRRAIKQAMDFTDRSPIKLTITERGKTEFEVSVDDTNQPEFLTGLLEQAITMLGGKNASVTSEGARDGQGQFRASWR